MSRTYSAKATHSAGGELLYEWVSDSTYRLIFKFYRDCSGRTTDPEVRVCYTNECDFYRANIMLQLKSPVGKEVFVGCPGYPTKCSVPTATLPGYEEYIYEGLVTLPSRCHKWIFGINIQVRNINIGNLVNLTGYLPPNHPMYLEATLNNEVAQGNSSPVFTVQPVPYICVNKPYTYNNGVYDPNNDALKFDHVQPSWMPYIVNSDICFYAKQVDIPYCCGYSMPANPFATNNTYSMDPVTGHMSFTPGQIQTAVVALRAKEYRNGVEIGSVMRDIQLVIIACNSPEIVAKIDSPSLHGGLFANNRVEGCVNTPMSVCMDFKTPTDPATKLVISDNHGVVLPAASVTYTRLNTDSVRACFQWTPGRFDTGLRVVVFLMKDSSCRAPGVQVSSAFTLPLYINHETVAWRDTAICAGDPVQLYVTGWPTFTWGVLPGGDPVSSLSCTTCINPIARPSTTTNYFVTADNHVCRKHTDTVTVTVLPSPTIGAIADSVTTCVGNSIQIGVNITKLPGATYDVRWSPASGLNNTTIEDPIASPNSDITYIVSVKRSTDKCISYDTVKVAVLQGMQLHNGDTAICDGSIVITNLTGDPRYTYRWRPAIGVSDTTIMQPLINPDTSRTYTVVATYPGCRDTMASFFIDVQPVPTVTLPPDTMVCRGAIVEVVPVITPASYPNYTYAWHPVSNVVPGPESPRPKIRVIRTTTYTLEVSTSAGCKDDDDILLEVAGIGRIQADTGICPGDTIQIFVEGSITGQVWRPDKWISDTASLRPYVYPQRTTIYTVYTVDEKNCLDTQSVKVQVYPQAVIYLPDSVTIYPGEPYQMNPGGNVLYYQWFPYAGLSAHDIANPYVNAGANTRYFVEARTEHGCLVKDSIDILVSDSWIDMPNAFVPGSPYNGTLKPVRRGVVTIKTYQVFNRWGQKVFETKDINEGWDGKLNGTPQPEGVYVYIIEAYTPGGKRFYKQGNATLLR